MPGTYEQQHFIKTWKEKGEEENYLDIKESLAVTLRRYRGCLIGLAVGDALGVSVESLSIGQFKPITDMLGGGRFNLKQGEWSDATALALCVAESLVEAREFNGLDIMNRFLRWRNDGHLSCNGKCIGIEYTVSRALEVFEQTGNPEFEKLNPYSADNTSLVRVAPKAMFYRKNHEAAIRFAEKNSFLTHGSKTAADACIYFAEILIGALSGFNKNMLLSDLYPPIQDLLKQGKLQPAIELIAKGSFKRRFPPSIKSTNYVVDSLEAALWAFYRSADFKEGALMLANLGDDASTACAIYGQLAGAFYGISDLPIEWTEKLSMKQKIEEFATQIFNFSEQ
jgi:ADP-ribosylglycohydrolase